MLSRKNTLRDSASGVVDQLRPHVEEARKKAEPAIREAAAKARTEGTRVAAEAKEKAQPLLDDARRGAGPALADARAKAEPAIREAAAKARVEGSKAAQEARKKTAPAIDEARRRVQPAIDEALDKAAPIAAEARRRAEDLYDEKVLPGVATALTLAEDATSELRQEAGRRGSAAVSALKGDVEPPKEGSPVRKVLIAVGLAGVAGFVAKKLGDRQAAQAWESAYTSNPPAPSTAAQPSEAASADASASTTASGAAPAGGKHKANDVGGGNPGEAVADDADEPRAASTPDAPADVVEVEVEDDTV